VIVVGGGIVGCATAEALARASADVVLFERGTPGGEASGAAAGLLTAFGAGPRTQFQDLAVASWRLYPTVAADLRERTGIDVELVRRGTLYPFFDAGEIAEMTVPEPLATEFGAQLLDEEQVRRQEPALSPKVRGALFVAGDHWVNSQRLVTAYAQAAALAGVEMRTGSRVTRIRVAEGRARGVLADGEEVGADAVLVAAGAWSGEVVASLPGVLPVAPARGQMVALSHVPPVLAHCINADDVYLVPRPSGELLIGATVEHVGFRREVTARGVGSLVAAALDIVPALGDRAITRTWYGFRPWTPDGLPVLGPWPGVAGLFVATGHYRSGIMLAPITARLMAQWILEGVPSIAVTDFLPDRYVGAGRG
jgi:glycine oxidase